MTVQVSRRRLVQIASLGLSAAAFGVPLAAARAQEGDIPATGFGPFPGLNEMAGLESVVSRQYMAEEAADMLFATAEPGTPAHLGMLAITIAAFATDEDAEASRDAFVAIIEQHLGLSFADATGADLEGVDDPDGVAGTMHFGDLGFQVGGLSWSGGTVVRSGSSVIMATGNGYGESPVDPAWDQVRNIVVAVIDTPAGDGPATWVSDGTSSGGDWERLPDSGDAVLGDVAAPSVYSPFDTALFPEWLF